MKRAVLALICIALLFSFAACAGEAVVKDAFTRGLKPYYELSDGTWKCEDHIYKYRLEISGRMPNASRDSRFVYLSNIPEISFQRAYLAAGISSFSGDYFSLDEAVLVEME